jgi:acid phosphatase family membrane protein YuiD
MSYLEQIFGNRILITGLIGWGSAQVLKTIIFLIVNRKLELERLFGDGGMPSGHSATVSAVATYTGFECGFGSPLFALAAILAIIVMHDATGVRLETGKQAKVLNEMTDILEKLSGTDLSNEEKLKEFVGHTPFQVSMGCILGIVVALIMRFVF